MKNILLTLLLISLFFSCNNQKQKSSNIKEDTIQEQTSNVNNEEEFQKLIELGRKYLNNKQVGEAFNTFKKASELAPNKPDGFYGMGMAQGIICEETETNCNIAIEYFKKALLIQRSFRNTNYNIGNCYSKLKEYAKSIEYFDIAIQNNKTNGEYYFNRGYSKLQINDNNGACEDFHNALKYGANKAKEYLNKCIEI